MSVAIGLGVALAYGAALVPVVFLMLFLGFGMVAAAGPLTLPILFQVSPYVAPVAGAAAGFVMLWGWTRSWSGDGVSMSGAVATRMLAACLGWLAGLYLGIGISVVWILVSKLIPSTPSLETMSYGAILGAIIGWLLVPRWRRRRASTGDLS